MGRGRDSQFDKLSEELNGLSEDIENLWTQLREDSDWRARLILIWWRLWNLSPLEARMKLLVCARYFVFISVTIILSKSYTIDSPKHPGPLPLKIMFASSHPIYREPSLIA